MNYYQFMNHMQQIVQDALGEKYDVVLHQVKKNNGVILWGLSIKQKSDDIAPTIYLESFYAQYCRGQSIEEITTLILGLYEDRAITAKPDYSFYKDYEKVKPHLGIKLVNLEKNKALLEEIPFSPFLDLAVIYYCQMGNSVLGNATVTVTNQHIKNWHIDKERLHQDAMENAVNMCQAQIMNMEDVVEKILEEHKELKTDPMFPSLEGDAFYPMKILTNQDKFFGAASILYPGVLEYASGRMGGDMYILPSSIHEVILLSAAEIQDATFIESMIKEVNETHVSEEERLSDNLYFYNASKGKMEIFRK